jgi:hypothetical protein
VNTGDLIKRREQMEAEILDAVHSAVERFREDTDLSPESVSVTMVPIRCLGASGPHWSPAEVKCEVRL